MTDASEYIFESAVMLLRAGKRDEASALLWEVVRKNPRHAAAWSLRGQLEAHAGRYPNAMLHHALAIQAAPDSHELWCNRGIDAMGAKMHKESEESFQRSLALEDTYNGHFNYANLLSSMMRLEEAAMHYDAAVKIDPQHVNQQVRVNLGQCRMALGNWHDGFNGYRHRFNAPGFPPAPRLNYPHWHGESLDLKTVLLFVEQGFGDEIMSLRFAEPIRKLASRIIVTARPPMFRLARSLPWADAVILQYDTPPWQPDYQCALLDVPAFLDIGPDNLPGKTRYLASEDRGFTLGFPPGLNVGVCWAAGKRELQPEVAETSRAKTLTFKELVAPLARPGVNLVSLQQNHNDSALLQEFGVRDPMPGVIDFADTAWIIDQLDLVISVDTSVAHLAGALGKPVWNLVRFDGIWPWMRQTRETCWYDSMTIYRQDQPGNWREPLKRLHSDFAALSKGGALLRAPDAA